MHIIYHVSYIMHRVSRVSYADLYRRTRRTLFYFRNRYYRIDVCCACNKFVIGVFLQIKEEMRFIVLQIKIYRRTRERRLPP